ncbi:MAG: holo-[acyl-carrier-protein] synthase [Chloroflexota bacterium]|jgi:holo-[acyl-carrier protein] synthase
MQAHLDSGAERPALGIDIVRVERIAGVLQRHPVRFPARVLTDGEQEYVRARPENFAGRWAAKEAVSKVLGLGIRGIGWREIEIERLPTGAPTVRLHGSAAERAARMGIAAIAVSITHEREYAVAVAYGQRTGREA